MILQVGRDLIPLGPTPPGHGYPSIPTKVDTDAFRRLEDVVRRLTLGDETAEPELAKAWKKLGRKVGGRCGGWRHKLYMRYVCIYTFKGVPIKA